MENENANLNGDKSNEQDDSKLNDAIKPSNVEMVETRIMRAKLICGDQSQELVFRLMPEVPSLTAASALAEMRKTLRKFVKQDSVSVFADRILDAFDNSQKLSFKKIISKVVPFLNSSTIQKSLYGSVLSVEGPSYVQETLTKELKGVQIHIAILIECVKEDPLLLAKLLPLMSGDEPDVKKKETFI